MEYLAKDISVERFMQTLTQGPAHVLGLDYGSLQVGDIAQLTVVDQGAKWDFDATTNASLSKNTHTWNTKLSGRVKAVFHRKKVNLY